MVYRSIPIPVQLFALIMLFVAWFVRPPSSDLSSTRVTIKIPLLTRFKSFFNGRAKENEIREFDTEDEGGNEK
jgi:hypothetical protein